MTRASTLAFRSLNSLSPKMKAYRCKHEEEEEEVNSHITYLLCGALSRGVLSPINLAFIPNRAGGRLR